MAISSQVLFYKNGQIALDPAVATDFRAGAPLGQKEDGTGYSLYKAGDAGKVYVGPSLNDRKDSWGIDQTPTVCEAPTILELVEDSTVVADKLFATGITFTAGEKVYVDANGYYTDVATSNTEVGVIRQIFPVVIKFTV